MAKALPKDQRFRRTVGFVRGIDFGRFDYRLRATDAHLKTLHAFVIGLIQNEDVSALTYIKRGGAQYLQIAQRRYMRGNPITTSNQSKPLEEAFATWLESASTKSGKALLPSTSAGYAKAIAAILRFAEPNATPEMLPDALKKYREHCVRHDQNSRFNQAKTVSQAFARATEGRASALYLSLRDGTDGMHTDRKRVRKSNITPRMVRRIMRRMIKQGDSHFAQHAWNICALACRIDEYVTATPHEPWKLHVQPERKCVYIDGTKFASAKRYVPLLPGVKEAPNRLVRLTGTRLGRISAADRSNRAFYTVAAFGRAFVKATKGEFEPNDLRASGLTWMRRAGVDPIMRKVYFAHSLRGIDERYSTMGHTPSWDDMAEDVRRDRALMVRWLKQQLKKQPASVNQSTFSPRSPNTPQPTKKIRLVVA